ncbi:MAG: hypothetical protein QXM56_02235 [Acidilobaceae archaeon]
MRHDVIAREQSVLENLISKAPKQGYRSLVSLSLISELLRLVKLAGEVLAKTECSVRGKGSCISGGSGEKYCHTGCYGYRVVEKSGISTLFRYTDRPLAISAGENFLKISTKLYSIELMGSRVRTVLRDVPKELEVDLADSDSLATSAHLFKITLPELIRELEVANVNLSTCLRMSAIACS